MKQINYTIKLYFFIKYIELLYFINTSKEINIFGNNKEISSLSIN